MSDPLVSCVMPTKDRPGFVALAVSQFLRQDDPNRELVIVDDGMDPVGGSLPADPRISCLRLDRPHRLGAKRNVGCQGVSRGDLIAQRHDDHWMRGDRLSRQVSALVVRGADACGLSELVYVPPLVGEAWRYRPAPQDRPWLAEATLLYRRGAWHSQPSPDIDVEELHPGNSGPKGLGDRRWQPVDYDEVLALLAPDRALYAGLLAGRTQRPAEPAAARSGTTVTLVSDLFGYDGYAGTAEYLALRMGTAGARVNLVPITLDTDGLSTELYTLLRESRPDLSGPVIYCSFLRPELARYANRKHVIHTMRESSRLPAGWPAKLNRIRAVPVPTRFVADMCRASGVDVPRAVVPDGCDPVVYPLLDRPARPVLASPARWFADPVEVAWRPADLVTGGGATARRHAPARAPHRRRPRLLSSAHLATPGRPARTPLEGSRPRQRRRQRVGQRTQRKEMSCRQH